MNIDNNVCLCFHVSKRKLVNYIRVEKPTRASQLSQCQGAGTGCGWCVPYLSRLFEAAQTGVEQEMPDNDEYARMRKSYIDKNRETESESGKEPPAG